MTTNQRNGLLRTVGITQVEIARRAEKRAKRSVSNSLVCHVLADRYDTSATAQIIKEEVARAVDRPVEELWPSERKAA